MLRILMAVIGAITGPLTGMAASLMFLWIIGDANALKNPDLPGGMAWLFVIVCCFAGLLGGVIAGWIIGGRRMFWDRIFTELSSPADPHSKGDGNESAGTDS